MFRAIDEDIGPRGLTADVDAFGEGFEFDLLILDAAILHLQGRLDGLIPFLLDLKAVLCGGQIVEAAGRIALAQNATRRAVENSSGTEHVGNDVNGPAACPRNGVSALFRIAIGGQRRVVVLDVINHADIRRRVPQELQEFAMFRRAELSRERQCVARGLNFRATV